MAWETLSNEAPLGRRSQASRSTANWPWPEWLAGFLASFYALTADSVESMTDIHNS